MLAKLDSLSELLREDMSRLDGDINLTPVINGVYASKFMDTWYRCVVEEVFLFSVASVLYLYLL